MRRPAIRNTIDNGDGNIQIGENSGTITVGYTIQEHQAALEKAIAEKSVDLERAHGAERDLFQTQKDALQIKLTELQNSYEEKLHELENTKRLLARHENQFGSKKRDAAYHALNEGETTLAQALLKELSQQARNRREDAAHEEAEFEFELGKIAEMEVRWADAAAHYTHAARLVPKFEALYKATHFTQMAGDHRGSERLAEELVADARKLDQPEKLFGALD